MMTKMIEKNILNECQDNLKKIFNKGVETLPQALLYQSERFANKIFYRKKEWGIWQNYTWIQVLNQVKFLAMGLSSLGVKREESIAIIGENEPEFFWSEFAAQAIGAKVVCLYPDLTSQQMEYLLSHSNSVLIICGDQEQVDKVLQVEPHHPLLHTIVYWDEKGMWKYDHPKLMTFEQMRQRGKEYLEKNPGLFERETAAGKGSDIAILSYTSGTTGLPKGCIVTHANLLDYASRSLVANPINPFSKYLSYIPPAWLTEQIFGITIGLLTPLEVNFPEEPETVQQNIREIGVQALMLSPRQWESLASLVESKMIDAGPFSRWLFRICMNLGYKNNLRTLQNGKVSLFVRLLYPLADLFLLSHLRDNLGLQSLDLAISGGSGMAPDVFRFFHAIGVKLRNGYGNTEIGLFTSHQGDKFDVETVGTWYRVLEIFGPPLQYKVTEEGELLVKGGSGFSGYFKNPEATAQAMQDGWFKTGDAVYVTKKNELVYQDRVKDLRELATGHSYPPQYIESRLRFSPFIKDIMTIGDRKKPFVTALVNIDLGTLGSWAEQRRIGYTTFTDLSQNENIRSLIQEEIMKVNKFLPEGSKVKRFVNLPKELDPDEDELTRTRKLRRNFLEEKYAYFIEAMYGGTKQFQAEIPVTYQDGRSGVIEADVYVNDLETETQ
jgi:long-chain acyl-CoA synthetase